VVCRGDKAVEGVDGVLGGGEGGCEGGGWEVGVLVEGRRRRRRGDGGMGGRKRGR